MGFNCDSDDIEAGLKSDRRFIGGLNALVPKLAIADHAKVEELADADFLLIRKLTLKKGETVGLTLKSS